MFRPLNTEEPTIQQNVEEKKELYVSIPKSHIANSNFFCRKKEIIPASELNYQAAKKTAKGCACCLLGMGCCIGATFVSSTPGINALMTLCLLAEVQANVQCSGSYHLWKAGKKARLLEQSRGPEHQTMETISIHELERMDLTLR